MATFTVNGQAVTVEKNQKLLRFLRFQKIYRFSICFFSRIVVIYDIIIHAKRHMAAANFL